MLLLVLFSFIAGVVTVLSPCILPVLPIVLSTSVSGGKRRPVGVIVGFILSFTFFTLFISLVVKFLGLSGEVLRTISVVVIFALGLSLLVPQFQIVMERIFSKLSRFVPVQKQSDGLWGGVVVGLSLGLLWTPCVGPILGTVFTLAATNSVSLTTVFITLAYAIGTAIPMFLIMYGGRRLLNKVPGLFSHLASIQKAFGVFMILLSLAVYTDLDKKFQVYVATLYPQYGAGLTQIENIPLVRKELDKIAPPNDVNKTISNINDTATSEVSPQAPELIPGGQWFNSKPLTLAQLKGKVVMIDFWTYTCINCIRTLPYIEKWHEKYSDKGLVIIGVHTPEFEFEKLPDNVKKAIADFKLKYPVMQDNKYETWNAYNNRAWPAHYLIDKNGRIRDVHEGEGEYDQTEKLIQSLLAEAGSNVSDIKVSNPEYSVDAYTRETYVGYERNNENGYYSSSESIVRDQDYNYTLPVNTEKKNSFAFGGKWMIGSEYGRPAAGSKYSFNFSAKNVYLVMRPKTTGVSGKVRILIDGKPIDASMAGVDVKDSVVTVDSDRLYTLVQLAKAENHVMVLEFLDDNMEIYAFTFG